MASLRTKCLQTTLKRHGLHLESLASIMSSIMASKSSGCSEIRSKIGHPQQKDDLNHRVDNHCLHKSLNANDSCKFENWSLNWDIACKWMHKISPCKCAQKPNQRLKHHHWIGLYEDPMVMGGWCGTLGLYFLGYVDHWLYYILTPQHLYGSLLTLRDNNFSLILLFFCYPTRPLVSLFPPAR